MKIITNFMTLLVIIYSQFIFAEDLCNLNGAITPLYTGICKTMKRASMMGTGSGELTLAPIAADFPMKANYTSLHITGSVNASNDHIFFNIKRVDIGNKYMAMDKAMNAAQLKYLFQKIEKELTGLKMNVMLTFEYDYDFRYDANYPAVDTELKSIGFGHSSVDRPFLKVIN